jgi:hypothetical protein
LTRFAVFVKSRGFVLDEYEEVSGVRRQIILNAMNGTKIRIDTVARLVRGARLLSGENVTASQLFDLADDVPPAPAPPQPWPEKRRRF